jgi:hypothetical protein
MEVRRGGRRVTKEKVSDVYRRREEKRREEKRREEKRMIDVK